MTDIISFSWSDKFAVEEDFDLNILRKFKKVKEVNSNYLHDEKSSGIEISIGKKVITEQKEIEENELQEAIKDKKNYQTWYNQEQTKSKKLEAELECLKKQIAEGLV